MTASAGARLLWSPQLVTRVGWADDLAHAVALAGAPLVELGAVKERALAAAADAAGAADVRVGPVPYALCVVEGLGALRLGAAVAVFKTPVSAPRGGQFRVVALASVPPGQGRGELGGLEDALADGELAEVLLTVPASEAHQLLVEAVDFYVTQRARGRALIRPLAPAEPWRELRGARTVWTLLETGDNFLKYAGPEERERAVERARRRYEQARDLARDLGDDRLARRAELRLADLGRAPQAPR